ncbi:hypothetical protein AVEN_171326-1 [Araneus ventricosus]|uniref:Uncharacterized protein n=1 Tax=Araneus ventricosus TaxID=182803 RepID=A0A4Y2M3V7_ARAVE|nr:hypothetical protein AVEN_171326-1 [Araneus ventricosus]
MEAKSIGFENGETYFIPQIPLIPSDSNLPLKFKRKQFPVRLACSMTISKAQGQTFEKICVMLNNPVFSRVGFSSVKSFDSVTVVAPSEANDHPTPVDFLHRTRMLLAELMFAMCGNANYEPDDDIIPHKSSRKRMKIA